MEGYLWLLLQSLPLLALTAAVFFILGWRWRAQDNRHEEQARSQKSDAGGSAAETTRKELDETRGLEEKVRTVLAQTQAELQESQDRQTLLQKEVLRLSDQLRQAQSAPATTAPSPDNLQEKQNLLEERRQLETEKAVLEATRSSWQTEQAAIAKSSPTPKARPAKKAAAKSKKPRGKKAGDTSE